ncbi:GSCFA domain-containing protein [Hymenobacter latericus]|uniref:GSCFA domain-containing protein n=1 Tax=Hymenobacter sp. YIM 151858-1 TaxID=2987688 RepID=UPI002225B915|nr:GSCFA domain-containing protein [Hymenobacter sp. YIM 151858-1]UYZ59269.1 GSCFA domain-containing protein [Hymenobacter sp. YIM 151858-1]
MFRTELTLRPDSNPLSLGARVLTLGSCFSDVIGERLAQYKVRTLVNPFGTVFNPLAAARLLRAVAGEETDWQQHLVEARGRWQSFDLHATLGADSPPALLQRIEQTVRETAEFVRSADVLVWTLGTAFGYRLQETGEVVNNCHKIPAERFEKELLSAEEIITAVTEAYALLRQINPKLRLILTVSPVRHLRDTLPLNAVSKSVLRVACHYLSELLPEATYFPAYELLLDDLRDYRFYAADMLHPSEVAEQYIWEKFTAVYFDGSFRQFAQEWEGIRRALEHRPLHVGAPEHRHFLEQTQLRLQRLAGRVDVRAEMRDVHKRIVALPPPPKPVLPPEPEDDEERIDIGEGTAQAEVPRPEPVAQPVQARQAATPVSPEAWVEAVEEQETEDLGDVTPAAEVAHEMESATPETGPAKRRKRKRGGRKHKRKNRAGAEETVADASQEEAAEQVAPNEPTEATEAVVLVAEGHVAEQPQQQVTEPRPPKRRGRPTRQTPALYAEPQPEEQPEQSITAPAQPVAAEMAPEPAPAEAPAANAEELPQPQKPKSRSRAGRGKGNSKLMAAVESAIDALPTLVPALPAAEPVAPVAEEPSNEAPTPPRRRPAPRRKPAAAAAPTPAEPVPEAAPAATPDAPAVPTDEAVPASEAKRRGRPPRRKPQEPPATT